MSYTNKIFSYIKNIDCLFAKLNDKKYSDNKSDNINSREKLKKKICFIRKYINYIDEIVCNMIKIEKYSNDRCIKIKLNNMIILYLKYLEIFLHKFLCCKCTEKLEELDNLIEKIDLLTYNILRKINNGRIMILISPIDSKIMNIINWMVQHKTLNDKFDFDIYTENVNKENKGKSGKNEKTLDRLKKYHSLGYRCFIGDQSSDTLLQIKDFIEDNNIIYFNSFSTSPYDINVKLSRNIIRTAILDDELCFKLIDTFIKDDNFYKLLKLGKHDELAEPLENSHFTDIIYIYHEDVYTSNYLKSLESVINGGVEIKSYIIDDDATELPVEVHTLLSDKNYKDINKTLFIINSSTPVKMMNLLNSSTENYVITDNYVITENYILFGDPFFNNDLISNIKFPYSLVLTGNFSEIGYKLSKFIDINQNISPMILNIIDITIHFSHLFFNSENETNDEILDNLMSMNYLKYSDVNKRYYWFIKQEYMYRITTNENNKFDYNMLFFNSEYNPNTIGVVTSDPGTNTREYQSDLLIKIGTYINLYPELYPVLIPYYTLVSNSFNIDELRGYNDEIEKLIKF